MKIVIESIPHAQHRYPTIGDYWRDPDGTLQIRVSEMADLRSMVAIALHEFVEVHLCEDRGIAEADIMAFDIAALLGPYANDPGHSPEAPYHHEHVFAEIVERQMALELGLNWQKHDAACLALDGKKP